MDTGNLDTTRFTGSLTCADMRQPIPIHVTVPEGATHIHFRFDYVPKQVEDQRLPYQISLMIFDPHGPRVEVSHPDEAGVFIHAAGASPGGTPGPVFAGQWTVFVLVHRLLSDAPVAYELEVTTSFDPIDQDQPVWEARPVADRGPGWYRGDLHAHTIHSDGRWDVPDIVQFWKEMGADFMTVSDHNTISGLAQTHSLADDRLLTMGGLEFSTFFGHAVAVGIHEWLDWRTVDGRQISMPELARQVIERDALFVIAHPMDPGDPGCCGCRWEYDDMMPGNAQAVEVWNGFWEPRNQEALQLFYRWLDQGHRLTATAGTDLHGPPPQNVRGALNVVFAESSSEKAIIRAIREGHSYISAGPELLLTARTASGVEGMIGDTLPAEATLVTVRWKDGYQQDGHQQDGHQQDGIRFVVDGKVYREKIVGPSGVLEWQIDGSRARWCNVELRDSEDGLWAVTNPIFFA